MSAMKNVLNSYGLILMLACAACVVLSACGIRPKYDARLMRADSLMNPCPDSALALMESFPVADLHTRADSAYYALLLTQARDKNYVRHRHDSLIKFAAEYFDGTGETDRQARVYYLWGGVFRDLNAYGKAIEKYSKALSLAKECHDLQQLGVLYNNMAMLYYSEDLNGIADSLYLRMEEVAVLRQDSFLLAEALAQRGRIKMETDKNEYAQAGQLLSRALAIAESLDAKSLEEDISASLSTLHSWMKDGEKALSYAKRSWNLRKSPYNYRGYMLLGNGYYQTGEYDSAVVFLRKSLSSNSHRIKSDSYMLLADIAMLQGDTALSLKYERLYSSNLHAAQQSLQSVDILQATRLGNTIDNKKSFSSGNGYWIILVAAVVSFALAVRYFPIRRPAKVDEEQRPDIGLPQTPRSSERPFLQEEVRILERKRNTLMKDAYQHSQVYDKMRRIIRSCRASGYSDERLTEEDWKQLVAETDMRWGNITLRLQEKYDLTVDDIHVCCLYLTDFSTSHLRFLLGCSRDSVYRKGYNILEKKIGISRKASSLRNFLKSF